MKKFEIRSVCAEVAIKDKDMIKPGIAREYNINKYGNGDTDLIASYDTLEEARKDLAKRKSSVYLSSSFSSKYYMVEEYFIEENEYSEDGEITIGGDIWDFSVMDFEKF